MKNVIEVVVLLIYRNKPTTAFAVSQLKNRAVYTKLFFAEKQICKFRGSFGCQIIHTAVGVVLHPVKHAHG